MSVRLWGRSFAVIAALHVLLIWAVVQARSEFIVEAPPPPPAIMIDLPPMPVARPAPARHVAPAPARKHVVVQPRISAPRVVATHVDVPVPEAKVQPQRIARPVPATVASVVPDTAPSVQASAAPQQVAASAAPVVAATAAPVPAPASNAVPTWQGAILGRLERFKRYPASAQARRQQGVVYLRFSMDRHGKVVAASIDRSSGVSALDDETLALIHRAEPLPPPPAEVAGDPVELVVPVQFFLK